MRQTNVVRTLIISFLLLRLYESEFAIYNFTKSTQYGSQSFHVAWLIFSMINMRLNEFR